MFVWQLGKKNIYFNIKQLLNKWLERTGFILPLLPEPLIEQCSIHEAGHAISLMCCSKKHFPDICSLSLAKTFKDAKSGVGGGLQLGFNSGIIPQDLDFNFWLMCNYRAGYLAEKLIYGQVYIGSVNDFSAYEGKAKIYCSLSDDYNYFSSPDNEYEHESNKEQLLKLTTSIDKKITTLLDENRNKLFLISKKLKSEAFISHECLLSLLEINCK